MEPEFSVAQGGPGRYAVLNSLVQYLRRPSVTVLEVGSFEGQSALVWSAAILEHCPAGGQVLCVDPWSPDYLKDLLQFGPAYRQMEEELRSGEVYRRFCHNVTLAGSRAPIDHLKGTLQQVYDQLQGRMFDIVYIDGDHRASAVREDLALARGMVSRGGLLCGDDLEVQGGECDWDSALGLSETTDYVGYHPGVTVAVWQIFGRVWVRKGTWAMQRTGEHTWQQPEGLP